MVWLDLYVSEVAGSIPTHFDKLAKHFVIEPHNIVYGTICLSW